jgi:hypothetical protein
MDTFTDYYAQLGVDVDASTSEIKAAFKKLALQYHPDVYKGNDAHERMREILRAYQTLSDSEERRQYDLRRSEHLMETQRSSSGTQRTSSSTRSATSNARSSNVSSSARRDRERAYDFPSIRSGYPVHISLLDMDYDLSSTEAQTLQQQGLLRGGAPETRKHDYHCHRCKHNWRASSVQLADEEHLPLLCPKCGARDWAEYLLLRCVHCCAVFESEQIRNQVGSVSYGNTARASSTSDVCPPYELFPLCPYCGVAHWCPSEETRVTQLRAQLARKAAFMRMLWVGVMLCVILVLGVVALSMAH